MTTPTTAEIYAAARATRPDDTLDQLGCVVAWCWLALNGPQNQAVAISQISAALANGTPAALPEETCQGGGQILPGVQPAAAMPQPGEQPAAPPVAESNSEAAASKSTCPAVAGSGVSLLSAPLPGLSVRVLPEIPDLLLSAPCGAETRPEPKEPAAMETGDGREFLKPQRI